MALPKASEMFQQKTAPSEPVLLPADIDLNAFTDQVLKDKPKLDAESEASRKKFAEELLASRIKAAREDIAAAQEAERNAQWHRENAKTRAEEAARLAVGRQIRLKRKLTELTAACASAQSLIDAIEDKNSFEISHFKSTIGVLNNSLNSGCEPA